MKNSLKRKAIAVKCLNTVLFGAVAVLFFLPLGAFLLVLYLTKIIALSSILSAAAVTIYVYFTMDSPPVFWALVAFTLLILVRHRKNIQRMLRHEENTISWM